MNVKTHLANALEQAKAKSDYDEYVIRILSNKYILANILQGTISECKRLTIPQIIESMKDTPEIKQTPVHPCVLNDVIIGDRTEDKVPDEGTTTFDIRFHIYLSDAPQPIKLIINVEAQKNYYPGYDLVTRGIYYGARLISSQRETEFTDSDYDNIKKIYSLWICTNTPAYAKNTITEYKIKQEKVFGDFHGKARYDILNVTFICLGNPTDQETPRFLSMLSTVLSNKISIEKKKSILEEEYNIPMSRDLGKEMEKMCNLSEAIEEQGIQKGIEKGIEKGSKQNAIENAKRLFENGASYQLVRNSIVNLTDEEMQTIYDEVMKNKEK